MSSLITPSAIYDPHVYPGCILEEISKTFLSLLGISEFLFVNVTRGIARPINEYVKMPT